MYRYQDRSIDQSNNCFKTDCRYLMEINYGSCGSTFADNKLRAAQHASSTRYRRCIMYAQYSVAMGPGRGSEKFDGDNACDCTYSDRLIDCATNMYDDMK